MYNGIGLQTPRGSGTNGYIQTNKFFVKPRTGPHKPDAAAAAAGGGDAAADVAGRKPNRDILEHDRKRQIELRLLILRETLEDQGYTEAEIDERIEEKRRSLEAEATAASDAADAGVGSGESRALANKRF